MIQYVRNFQKFRPLLGELVMRDVKIKYRKSVLGVLWTLLNPLLMMAVLSIVFSHLLRKSSYASRSPKPGAWQLP